MVRLVEVDTIPTEPKKQKAVRLVPVDSAAQATQGTDDTSFIGNALTGFGGGLQDLALGIRQRLAGVGAGIENAIGGQPALNRSLGLPSALSERQKIQDEIDYKRQLDAPLKQTMGGKVGGIASRVVPAVVAGMIPGGQGLAGSIAAGGLLGAAEPTSGDESALLNSLGGAAGGAAGYGLARGAGALLQRSAAKGAAAQQLNAVRDTTAETARAAGYTIPPTQTNPTMLNRALEGLAGKLTTGQSASIKNQAVTNRTIATALGLDPAKPITKDALAGLRAQAGQAYDAVTSIGVVTPGQSYTKALDDIVKPYIQAAQSFPNAKANPIIAEIDTLRTPQFDAASAIAKIRELRAGADKAFGSQDKELGRALRAGADALEDAIDAQLQKLPSGGGLLQGFREARQLIAKTYSVEKALNESTGNVAARKLASQLARGKPLSGDIKNVAQFAQAFPKAADEVASSMPGISPLDFYGAGGLSALTGNPLAMAAVGARPAARAAILSGGYQRMAGTPTYSPALIQQLMGSEAGRQILRASGIALGSQAGQ